MSRLGDLIRTERLRAKLTPKQVAKKCGVSESFIIAVEAGTRIIADDQARRILKRIGVQAQTEADFTLDDIAATVDLASVQPAMAQKVAAPKPRQTMLRETEKPVASTDEEKNEGVAGSIWLDALSSVLKRVPVMNAVMQPLRYRLLPVENGRVEGASPEKVFYFSAPDDSMRGFRIHRGDLAFILPAQSPVDGAIMLVEYNSHRALRKIKRIDDSHVLLQSYDREYEAVTAALNELNVLGRAARLEIELE